MNCQACKIPLLVRLRVGKSLEECRSGGGVFFLFGSFSFFTITCGNVGKSRGNNCRARLRMNSPTTGWLQGDFRIWPELEAKRMLRCCPSRPRLKGLGRVFWGGGEGRELE